MSFWGELKRRNVFKVGAAYAIAAWLILQVASITFPALNLPGWALTLVTVFIIIGFFIALILAWAYEVTPDGVKPTKEVPLVESIAQVTGRKLNYIVTSLLIIAIAYILFDHFYLDRRITDAEPAATVDEQAPDTSAPAESPKTIAVLPFDDLSPEKDQEYFVDGLTEELLNSLAQIPDLTVIAKTSSFTFKGSNKKIQEIADELGVAHILEGSVRKAGNDLRITAQLIKGADGSHLWSKTYDREFNDIFEVQEDIAKAVSDELKVTLGIGKSKRQLGGTDNAEAYGYYLVAKGGKRDATSTSGDLFTDIRQALELTDSAISLDPEFALAWAQKAECHLLLAVILPKAGVAEQLEAALKAAQRSIQIEPDMPEGYLQLIGYHNMKANWFEGQKNLEKVLELTTGKSPDIEGLVALYYSEIGFLEKAQALFEMALSNDPYNKESRGAYMQVLAFRGLINKAEEEYKLGMTLFKNDWLYGDIVISQIRLGYDTLSRDEIVSPLHVFDAIKGHFGSRENALSELRRFYSSSDNLSPFELGDISIWASYFGDAEFALEVGSQAVRLNAANIVGIWYPVMHEVRQLPKFKEFVREIGLVDYWNQFGWPDICHKLDNGDFLCD